MSEEKRAARLVRLAIQKVRVARPDTLAALETDVETVLSQQSVALGTQAEALEREAQKGLAIGRKHAKAVEEQLKKDAEVAERPRRLLKELEEVANRLEAQCVELTKALAQEDKEGLSERCEQSRSELEACRILRESFKKDKLPQVAAPTVPQFVKAEYLSILKRMEKSELEVLQAMKKAREAVVEGMCAKVLEDLQSAPEAVQAMELAVKKMEREVANFKGSTRLPMAEMTVMADAAEDAVRAGEEAVKDAKSSLQPKAEVMGGLDIDTRKTLDAMIRKQLKNTVTKHGLLERRLNRVQNLIRYFRQDIERKGLKRTETTETMITSGLCEAFPGMSAGSIFAKVDLDSDGFIDAYDLHAALESTAAHRQASDFNSSEDIVAIVNKYSARGGGTVMGKADFLKLMARCMPEEVLAELKPMVEQQAEDMRIALETLQEAVRDAERLVDPFRRSTNKPLSQMQDLADLAADGLARAVKMQEDVVKDNVIVDPQLDEGTKMQLLATVASKVKVVAIRQGQLDRRIHRVRNLIKIFRSDMERVKNRLRQALRSIVANLIQTRGKSADEVFEELDPRSTGEIDIQRLLDAGGDHESRKVFEGREEDISIVWPGPSSSLLSLADFRKMASVFMEAKRLTTVTDGLKVGDSKLLATVKVGEVVEVLEGPVADASSGLHRIRIRLRSGCTGWATMAGSKGMVYLQETNAPMPEAVD
mmetsp:Transcript_18280/g.42636  ORF Transcript_18280/g.42636 Transcript_18280/m.42636 type:complete len:708 (+) Transcript_18280:97-2220(+)